MARDPFNPDKPLDDLASALDKDTEQLRELLEDEGLDMRLEAIEEARADDSDEQLLRELTGNFRVPLTEQSETFEAGLRSSGRFRISDNDTMDGRHETKIIDGTTVRGTKIAADWETVDDGENETREVFVPVDELQDEISDFTGIAVAVTFAYQSSARGSATTVLSALDWRDRLAYYKLGWDNEVLPNVWQHYQEGLKITNVNSTGAINLFSVNMGGDTATVFIDGDDSGKLKLTSVDNGNFGDIGCLIEATGTLFGS